jgi:WD repeat-containing protein 42A
MEGQRTSSRYSRRAGGCASVAEQLRLRELGRRGVVAHPDLASRLSLVRRLREHQGCVHALAWSNGSSDLLVSGSDDLHINVWSMWGSALRTSHFSAHTNTIFSALLVPGNEAQAVSCAADGEVRLHNLEHGTASVLAEFEGKMVFKLAFRPDCASTFISTHEDGKVRLFDLRAPSTQQLLVDLGNRTSTTNLAFKPGCADLFAVGADPCPFVRTFDLRSCAVPLRCYAPEHLCHAPRAAYRPGPGGASGVDWSSGNLLAASYRNGDIFLFDTRESAPEPLAPSTACSQPQQPARPAEACMRHVMRYSGARNARGILKQVRFLFGGEYLATGSDCGRLFVWRTRTGRLQHILKADCAVANCLAPHAHLPLIAVSGFDHDIKASRDPINYIPLLPLGQRPKLCTLPRH